MLIVQKVRPSTFDHLHYKFWAMGQSSLFSCEFGWTLHPTIPLVYAFKSWTHCPASSSQEDPAAQDIACKLALFLEAHPPSPQANELVAAIIKTNALAVTILITNLPFHEKIAKVHQSQ